MFFKVLICCLKSIDIIVKAFYFRKAIFQAEYLTSDTASYKWSSFDLLQTRHYWDEVLSCTWRSDIRESIEPLWYITISTSLQSPMLIYQYLPSFLILSYQILNLPKILSLIILRDIPLRILLGARGANKFVGTIVYRFNLYDNISCPSLWWKTSTSSKLLGLSKVTKNREGYSDSS